MEIGLIMAEDPVLAGETAAALEGTVTLVPWEGNRDPDPALLGKMGILILQFPLAGRDVFGFLERIDAGRFTPPVIILLDREYAARAGELVEAGAWDIITYPAERGPLPLFRVARALAAREAAAGSGPPARPAEPRPAAPDPPGPATGSFSPHLLGRFTEIMHRIFDAEKLLETLVGAVGEVFGVARVALFMPGPDGREHAVRSALGWDGHLVGSLRFPASSGLVACLARDGQVLDAAGVEPAIARQMAIAGAKICVPLLSGGEMPGFLCLGNKVNGKEFSDPEREFLSFLAVYLGLTVDNAFLYRRLAEKSREQEQILGSLAAGVIAVDRRGAITAVNPMARELLCLGEKPLAGERIEAAGSQVADHARRALRFGEVAAREPLRPAGGKSFLQLSSSLIRDERAVVAGAVLIISDLAPVRELEARVDALERLNFWNQLAASMAHQIKNPLVSIKTFIQLFPEKHDDPEFRERFLGIVSDDVQRLDGIVNELFEFSRPTEYEMRVLEIPPLLEDLLGDLVLPEGGKPVIEKDFRDPPPVLADRDKIGRALNCLLDNALEAHGGQGGGPLVVRVRGERRGGGESALLEIENGGKFVPASPESEIFSPFYTTKNKGMGMGLPIARRIIEDHGGRLELSGLDRGGARARVVLPAAVPGGKP